MGVLCALAPSTPQPLKAVRGPPAPTNGASRPSPRSSSTRDRAAIAPQPCRRRYEPPPPPALHYSAAWAGPCPAELAGRRQAGEEEGSGARLLLRPASPPLPTAPPAPPRRPARWLARCLGTWPKSGRTAAGRGLCWRCARRSKSKICEVCTRALF